MKRLLALIPTVLLFLASIEAALPRSGTIPFPNENEITGRIRFTSPYSVTKDNNNVIAAHIAAIPVNNGSLASSLRPTYTWHESFNDISARLTLPSYRVAGTTFVLGQATPTPITTGNISFGAFTGLQEISSKLINGVPMCDQYTADTAGAKYLACIGDLPNTGGKADGTALQGAQTWAFDFFSSVAKPVLVVVGAGTTTITANTIIPRNVTLQLSQGAVLAPSTGVTLTINGGLVADLSQHFSGAGTVSIASAMIPEVYPQWFGAIGDGTTDDTAAIKATWSATPSGATVRYPPGTYLAPNGLTIPNKVLNHVGSSSYMGGDQSAGTIITASAAGSITIDTSNDGLWGSRWTTFRNITITNTGGGTCLRIRNAGINLHQVVTQAKGAGGIGIDVVEMFSAQWDSVAAQGSRGPGLRITPSGLNGVGALNQVIHNQFNNLSIQGGNVGIQLGTGGYKVFENTFINTDIEGITTGIAVNANDNTFIRLHIENNSGPNITETPTSSTLYISPSTSTPDFNISKRSTLVVTGDNHPFALAQGRWTTPPFTAGDFTTRGAMTWTVDASDVVTYTWTRIDKTLTVAFGLEQTSLGGVADKELLIAIPNGFVAAKAMTNPVLIANNSTLVTGKASVGVAGTSINISLTDNANFAASADNTSIQGQITFEVR